MPDAKKTNAIPPSEDEVVGHAEQEEDDRIAAEEASEVAGEDADVVTDAREERVP